jgi:uncharacterized protein (DUF433 family)
MSARAITVDPGIHFGQPCIAGTRIPVRAVLELVRARVAFDDIVGIYYPDLTIDDVQARVRTSEGLWSG